jgi:hypothetical protein
MKRAVPLCVGVFVMLLLLWPVDRVVRAQQSSTTTLSGRVERGTDGGRALPDNMPLELRIIDPQTLTRSEPFTTIAAPDGSFTFENIPVLEGNDFYLLYTSYAGFRQQTRPIFEEQSDFVVFLVYETTTVTDGLEVTGGYIQVDEFARIAQTGTNLSVVMELQIVNRGDRIVYDPETGTSLSFELPVGAYGVDEVIFEDEDRAVAQRLRIEEGVIPIAHETTPLIPGWPTHTIQLYYLIPYGGEAVFDQPFPLRIESLELLIPEDSVFIDDAAFAPTDETRFIAEERPLYEVYALHEPLAAGENLIFQMQGDPLPTNTANNTSTNATESEDSNVQRVVLFVGIGLFLVFVFVMWAVLRSRQAALAESTEQNEAA